MRVAIEQASGEKYRSIDASLVDFYTVPHNMALVKEFIAKWYKKLKS
jgi:hypothetical protein